MSGSVSDSVPAPVEETPLPSTPTPADVNPPERRREFFRIVTGNLWVSTILVAGSSILPWIVSPSLRATAFDIPVAFVYDLNADPGGVPLAWPILGLAGAILVGSTSRYLDWLRRLSGVAAITLPIVVMTQWLRFLSDADLGGAFWGFIGIGCYLILAGGLLAMFSASQE